LLGRLLVELKPLGSNLWHSAPFLKVPTGERQVMAIAHGC